MDNRKIVVAYIYGSRPEADLAKGELEAAGIPAMVQADTAGGMREHLAWSGAGFKILVREEDLVIARELLTPPPSSLLKEGEEIPEGDVPDEEKYPR
jgi:Putative prokaryotic signal transducing protein